MGHGITVHYMARRLVGIAWCGYMYMHVQPIWQMFIWWLYIICHHTELVYVCICVLPAWNSPMCESKDLGLIKDITSWRLELHKCIRLWWLFQVHKSWKFLPKNRTCYTVNDGCVSFILYIQWVFCPSHSVEGRPVRFCGMSGEEKGPVCKPHHWPWNWGDEDNILFWLHHRRRVCVT